MIPKVVLFVTYSAQTMSFLYVYTNYMLRLQCRIRHQLQRRNQLRDRHRAESAFASKQRHPLDYLPLVPSHNVQCGPVWNRLR